MLFIEKMETVLVLWGERDSQLKLYKELINISQSDVLQLPEGLILPGLWQNETFLMEKNTLSVAKTSTQLEIHHYCNSRCE